MARLRLRWGVAALAWSLTSATDALASGVAASLQNAPAAIYGAKRTDAEQCSYKKGRLRLLPVALETVYGREAMRADLAPVAPR